MLANEPMPFYLLARYGGPFEMGWIVELGQPRPAPDPPHVEDHVFVPARAKPQRPAAAHEFWVLEEIERPRLGEIFGTGLCEDARRPLRGPSWAAVARRWVFCGRPPRPGLYLARSREGKPQVRMKLTDGQIEADAGVTDLRLFGDDHATPEPRVSAPRPNGSPIPRR